MKGLRKPREKLTKPKPKHARKPREKLTKPKPRHAKTSREKIIRPKHERKLIGLKHERSPVEEIIRPEQEEKPGEEIIRPERAEKLGEEIIRPEREEKPGEEIIRLEQEEEPGEEITKVKHARKTKAGNILRIYRGDIKSLFRNPVAMIVILGLLVLPSLYAWVNIVACWDPYKNTDGIQVAVVNSDKTVSFEGQEINAGKEIVKKLKSNDAIGWDFVSKEKAEYGLTHDRYYAMLEIPEEFTEELLNVLAKDYKKPHIIYRVNEKSNAIAPKITDTGAKTVTNEVIKAIVEVVDQVVFSIGNDVGKGMDTNENKIKMMRDLIIQVDENFGEIEASLEKADKGLITVQELMNDANETLPAIQDGIYSLQDFSTQSRILLEDIEQARYDGVDYIGEKFAECHKLISEIRIVLNDAQQNIGDAEAVVGKITPMLEKAEKLNQEIGKLLDLLEKMDISDPNYDKWLNTIHKLQKATNDFIGVLEPIEQKLPVIQKGMVSVYEKTIEGMTNQRDSLQKYSDRLEFLINDSSSVLEQIRLQHQKKRVDEAVTKLDQQITELQAEYDKLKNMTPEEFGKSFSRALAKLRDAQKVLDFAEEVVLELDQSDVTVSGILTELQKVNAVLQEGIQVAEDFANTLQEAFRVSGDVFAAANGFLNDMDQAMLDLTKVYEDKWSAVLNRAFDDLYHTLNDLDLVLGKADEALPKVGELLALGMEAGDKGTELLAKLNEIMPEAKEDIGRLSAIMKRLNDNNLDQLINFLINDSDSSADYFSGPVELKEERLYHVDNYGSAMSPFYTVLAFWVGCLLLSALLTTEAKRRSKDDPEYTAMEEYFGKMMTFVTLAMGQALIVALGDKFLLGITVTNMAVFLGFSLLTALVFILIVYTMVSALGNVGKAICVIFLVLQIAGAGGTFPVEVMPEFYQIIQPYMPFTYAIGAMREAIFGPVAENLFFDFWHLAIFGLISLGIGILLKKPLHNTVEWFNKKFKESGLGE